jgi:hypothetical protein
VFRVRVRARIRVWVWVLVMRTRVAVRVRVRVNTSPTIVTGVWTVTTFSSFLRISTHWAQSSITCVRGGKV